MSTCPYCEQFVLPFQGRTECPHCRRPLFGVPCPHCGLSTLNLTDLPRYGTAACFACGQAVTEAPVSQPRLETKPRMVTVSRASARRLPAIPKLPNPTQLCELLSEYLQRMPSGSETENAELMAQCRSAVQEVLTLDEEMERGCVTPAWLRQEGHLDWIVRTCFSSIDPPARYLLPHDLQAWWLGVDDLLRRWQLARRRWLAHHCGLTLMPILPGVTTFSPERHIAEGEGLLVRAVLQPGFLLHDAVLCPAHVRCDKENTPTQRKEGLVY